MLVLIVALIAIGIGVAMIHPESRAERVGTFVLLLGAGTFGFWHATN